MDWDCKDWKAHCDHMPGMGEPTLHVFGRCTVPTLGYTGELRESVPQGIAYPKTLDVDLVINKPTGSQGKQVDEIEVRLDREGGPEHDVVNITDLGVSIEVEHIERK